MQRVSFADSHCPTNLFRNKNPSQIINSSHNPSCFHIYKNSFVYFDNISSICKQGSFYLRIYFFYFFLISNVNFALSSYQSGKFVPHTLLQRTKLNPSFFTSSSLLSNSRILPLPTDTRGEW